LTSTLNQCNARASYRNLIDAAAKDWIHRCNPSPAERRSTMRNSTIRYALIVSAALGTASATAALAPALAAQSAKPAQSKMPMTAPAPQEFVNKATITNLAEVELGKLAEDRAMATSVKTFAHQMVTDHTAAQDHLVTAAKAANVTVPSDIDQTHKDMKKELEGKTGAAFDRFYMEKMAQGHKDAAAFLRNASMHLTQADLKRWAASTLPTVEMHEKEAARIVKTLSPAPSN
jgi:putative membrane protein